jgi:hypothetical protein
LIAIAFSSEVDAGSREENASRRRLELMAVPTATPAALSFLFAWAGLGPPHACLREAKSRRIIAS